MSHLVMLPFYGEGFHGHAFLIAAIIFAAMLALNAAKFYGRAPYLLLGALLWYFVHESGLHASLARVLTAIAIPSRPSARIAGAALPARQVFEYELRDPEAPVGANSIRRLQAIVDRLRDPGFHLQHALENWNNFLILPLFAFFNTGIAVAGAAFSLRHPEVLGTVLGLTVGKPLGIMAFVALSVWLGIARKSAEISWVQMFGAACLCGIGFTMSIFIVAAAFEGERLLSVKIAVLLASVCSAVLGVVILLRAAAKPPARQ